MEAAGGTRGFGDASGQSRIGGSEETTRPQAAGMRPLLLPTPTPLVLHHDCLICARATNATCLLNVLQKITLTQRLIGPGHAGNRVSKWQLHRLMRLSVHASPVAND